MCLALISVLLQEILRFAAVLNEKLDLRIRFAIVFQNREQNRLKQNKIKLGEGKRRVQTLTHDAEFPARVVTFRVYLLHGVGVDLDGTDRPQRRQHLAHRLVLVLQVPHVLRLALGVQKGQAARTVTAVKHGLKEKRRCELLRSNIS